MAANEPLLCLPPQSLLPLSASLCDRLVPCGAASLSSWLLLRDQVSACRAASSSLLGPGCDLHRFSWISRSSAVVAGFLPLSSHCSKGGPKHGPLRCSTGIGLPVIISCGVRCVSWLVCDLIGAEKVLSTVAANSGDHLKRV